MPTAEATRRATEANKPLEHRIVSIADKLRASLGAIIRQLAGAPVRPSRLATMLDLDKSLASRLVRGLRADSPFELIHFIPAPTGLGIFLDKAEARADATLCRDARLAVDDFQRLLDEFPGGRSALDALLSENVVEVRERAERTAKQAVYKAMSTLLGFHCASVSSALILRSSADGASVDGIDVSRREGMRRLRPSTPVAAFSVDLSTERPDDGTPYLETLDGQRRVSDPQSCLLPEFCEPSPPAVEVYQEGQHTVFALAAGANSVHDPVTITSAFLVRRGWVPHRTEYQAEDGRSYLLHYPCKLLVRDLFIHQDLYAGAEPRVRLEFPSPASPPRSTVSGLPQQLNTLDLSAPVEHLGSGLRNTGVSGIPAHAKLLAHVFEESGWNPEQFRAYRTRIVYPVPMITMGWWIPLFPAVE